MSKLEKAFTVLTLMGSWILAAQAYFAGETTLTIVYLVLSLVEFQWWRHRKLEEDHKELKDILWETIYKELTKVEEVKEVVVPPVVRRVKVPRTEVITKEG